MVFAGDFLALTVVLLAVDFAEVLVVVFEPAAEAAGFLAGCFLVVLVFVGLEAFVPGLGAVLVAVLFARWPLLEAGCPARFVAGVLTVVFAVALAGVLLGVAGAFLAAAVAGFAVVLGFVRAVAAVVVFGLAGCDL